MLLLPGCKINIGLNVVARRPDGYHDLETVFYPIPLRDNLEINETDEDALDCRLTLKGFALDGNADDNLVVKVYRSLKAEFQLPSLDIFLYKNIPTGAGLGGGSSDAAYMMKGLNEAYDLGLSQEEMERRLAKFGADCPFFVKNQPAYATGIGDILNPINVCLKDEYILLVKPDIFVSTREAYSGITPRPSAHPLAEAVLLPVETWRDTVVNDFEEAVFAHHPRLAAIKQTLYDMGAVYAAMSGSGSTIYGLFNRPVPEAEKVFANCFVFSQRLIK